MDLFLIFLITILILFAVVLFFGLKWVGSTKGEEFPMPNSLDGFWLD